jgi:hypothetical protein
MPTALWGNKLLLTLAGPASPSTKIIRSLRWRDAFGSCQYHTKSISIKPFPPA